MTYKGNTYGIITDGNVHIHYLRKDLVENPDNQKRFADKHGKKLEFPQTWEDDLRIQQFFHDPEKDITGSGSLRNRANGATWWYMMFYSAGGFPFDNDMNPTLNTRSRQLRCRRLSAGEEVGPSGIARLGHAADDPTHRRRQGRLVPVLGRHRAAQREQGEVARRVGKWLYGLVPGSDKSGKRMHRSISSPLAAVLVNKYTPRKAQAAYLALWWATLKNSTPIVSDKVNTFHDAWHKGHMTAPSVVENYTPAGMKAIEQNMQVVSPPIYLTGYLEFQDLLGEEPVGSLCRPASRPRRA